MRCIALVTHALCNAALLRAPPTLLQATTVSAEAGNSALPFLLYVRHGTLELYVGAPRLMLVQTTRYGTYPQAAGQVGFAVQGGSAALQVSGLRAWKMNLAVLP